MVLQEAAILQPQRFDFSDQLPMPAGQSFRRERDPHDDERRAQRVGEAARPLEVIMCDQARDRQGQRIPQADGPAEPPMREPDIKCVAAAKRERGSKSRRDGAAP